MKLLDKKYVVITGASSLKGIGKATAKLFSQHGATIAILDLNEEKTKEVAAELGENHIGIGCDVTNKSNCEQSIQTVINQWGLVDVLANIAGISQPLNLLEIKSKNYDDVLDVNLRGTLYMSQAVIPYMQKQKNGSIVNMSSVSAQKGGGIFGGPHYCAAKAAILGLTKAMAREFATYNIRVNAVCPSLINTNITGDMLDDNKKQDIINSIPMGRLGEAEDVAGCFLFLASSLSSYVTGTEVDVNGGSHIH